jgi:C-terminal processing protease CtpA/Prc
MNARVVLAAIAAGCLISQPPALTAQQASSARASARSCAENCEQDVAELARQLERAQVELGRLVSLLARGADSLDAKRLQEVRRELATAMRSMERLQEQYQSQAMRRRITMARVPMAQNAIGGEGWLGVSFSGNFEVIERRGQPRVLRFQAYPVVEAVEPASPARHAGIEVGDVLLRFKEKDLRAEPIVLDEVLRPGTRLPIMLRRGNRTQTVTVTVGERPGGSYVYSFDLPGTPLPSVEAPPAPIERVRVRSATPAPAVAPTPIPPPRLWVVYGSSEVPLAGASMAPVPMDLHQTLGVHGGLLVLQIGHGTPAARAGLREGDVIVRANGKPILTSGDLQMAMREAKNRTLSLEVIRKKQTQTVNMEW